MSGRAVMARALDKREAQRLSLRLTRLLTDAEGRARSHLDQARREADAMLAVARAEAEQILARLPDFARIEATPASKDGKTAYRAIRDTADRHGLPMAAVVGRWPHKRAIAVRAEAVKAVADACPNMSDAEIGLLFSGLKAQAIQRIRRGE